jgi:uroporphyrinogen-III synthase
MKPLAGRIVLVTRPADQSVELVRRLRGLGATAIVAPTIEIASVRSAALTRALRDLSAGRFAWITLTSRSTVEMLASRLNSPSEVRARVAAIGDGTGKAYRAWARRRPDLMPTTFTTAGLARAFPRGKGRVLCARADIAPAGLEDALSAKGWSPVRVDAYRTRMARSLPAEARAALRDGRVDAITFTSASTVDGFAQMAASAGLATGTLPKIVCIGPVTARAATDRGMEVAGVARPHTIDGLIAALERVLPATARTKEVR